MAPTSPHEPLLSSQSNGHPSFLKPLLLTLSLAAIISLATIAAPHLAVHLLPNLSRPSDLCAHSPDPSSCVAVAGAASADSATRSPRHLLQTILRRSVRVIHASIAETADLHRRINDRRLRSALRDCLDLFDLSRDHITSSAAAIAAGSYADARTWLSAVLTNHVTCRDGLDGAAVPPLTSRLDTLTAQSSAALAVLRAVKADDGDITDLVITELPSWVRPSDRIILEASSAAQLPVNVTVAANGSGKFKTVQAAVDSSPDNGKGRFVIYVKAGTYKENVRVGKTKKNLVIVGDGMSSTVITGSLNFVDGTTTFDSATLAAVGDGFMLQDICIENTAGAEKHQAVALRVGADQAVINRCQIRAFQDTLYAHSLRQFYRDSLISGTIDFIFGDSAVVLQNCNLTSRKPMSNQQNLVTAQGRTDPNQNTGTSIQRCRITPAPDLLPVKGSIPSYLGRPWKMYSRTVVMQSYIDDHICPKGWLEWDKDFALSTLFYGEFKNFGPGAGTAGRVNWSGYHVITDPKVANDFTVASLIQGGQWLGKTGVDFTEGL
ncbi:Pectinesterase/pectinesterase inhibitor [Apostasia shenzhenica]|uniref:Pectinesterase n=1 Tax=Apostasia shenzhenica TaxID=1088818 RepID=A0A2H9ZQU3_9ASPA|nr:Pectinesterase/pectinesterase inhibitor [Apostasia shenzhenica]